jgi:HEAT repeat protein
MSKYENRRCRYMDKIEKWVEKGNTGKLEKILSKGSVQEKAAAIEALGRIGGEDAINLLVASLRSADLEVRKASVVAIGQTGATRAMEFLRKITRDEPDSEISDLARESMHKLAGSKE